MSSENNKGFKFFEIDLAEDVKAYVEAYSDACTDEIKTKLNNFSSDDLLKVEKVISSPLKIKNVELVTEELLSKDL